MILEKEAPQRFTFGECEFEPESGSLVIDGSEHILPGRAAAVLGELVARPGRLVTKQQLLSAAWSDACVTESCLTDVISSLRQLLGDNPKEPRFIQTLHGRGYRFVAEVEVPDVEVPDIEVPDIEIVGSGVVVTSEESRESRELHERHRMADSASTERSYSSLLRELFARTFSRRLLWALPAVLVLLFVAGLIAPGDSVREAVTPPPPPPAPDTEPLPPPSALQSVDRRYPESTLEVLESFPDAEIPMADGSRTFSVSPDGTRMVYIGMIDERELLVVRNLETREARVLGGTENAMAPTFTSDGDHVRFFQRVGQHTTLLTVPVGGQEQDPIPGAEASLAGRVGRESMVSRESRASRESRTRRDSTGNNDGGVFRESIAYRDGTVRAEKVEIVSGEPSLRVQWTGPPSSEPQPPVTAEHLATIHREIMRRQPGPTVEGVHPMSEWNIHSEPAPE